VCLTEARPRFSSRLRAPDRACLRAFREACERRRLKGEIGERDFTTTVVGGMMSIRSSGEAEPNVEEVVAERNVCDATAMARFVVVKRNNR
jgi:hypothetical protein